MKKFYLLFLVLNCAIAYGMEDPKEGYGPNILYDAFLLERTYSEFPDVCDDKTVKALYESFKKIITIVDVAPEAKLIVSNCLLGNEGLISPNALKKMSDQSKARVFTNLYYSILVIEQTSQYLFDYFLYLESIGVFKSDQNAYSEIYKNLCRLKEYGKYKSEYARFKEEILAFEQPMQKCHVIEKHHDNLKEFVTRIDDITFENFYRALLIPLYCNVSRRLAEHLLVTEATTILEKAKLFNCRKSKNLEKVILNTEQFLREQEITEMLVDFEILDQGKAIIKDAF